MNKLKKITPLELFKISKWKTSFDEDSISMISENLLENDEADLNNYDFFISSKKESIMSLVNHEGVPSKEVELNLLETGKEYSFVGSNSLSFKGKVLGIYKALLVLKLSEEVFFFKRFNEKEKIPFFYICE